MRTTGELTRRHYHGTKKSPEGFLHRQNTQVKHNENSIGTKPSGNSQSILLQIFHTNMCGGSVARKAWSEKWFLLQPGEAVIPACSFIDISRIHLWHPLT